MTMTRARAWICLLAVLLMVALPAAAGPPAVLAPAFALETPSGAVLPRTVDRAAAPDVSLAAAVSARAPPLA